MSHHTPNPAIRSVARAKTTQRNIAAARSRCKPHSQVLGGVAVVGAAHHHGLVVQQ